MLMVMAIATANASTWKMHNYYVQAKIQNIFDTGDKVYYLNSDHLFVFDKSTLTTIALNKQNLLSDSQISDLYYDCDNNLLFVAYANSNIDVIKADGSVTNISAIKDLVSVVHNYTLKDGVLDSHVGKAIRDITFGGGLAYVATGYGFVTINEETLKVEQEYDLGQSICINSVALMGETLLIMSNNRCYYGTPGDPDPIHNYQNATGSFTGCKMFPIDNQSVLVFGSSTGLHNYSFASGTPTLTRLVSSKATSVQRIPNGFIANFQGLAFYYFINATGTAVTKESSVISCASSYPYGNGATWIIDANGLHLKNSTTYYKINSLTTNDPYWLKYNASMNKLYVGATGPNILSNTDYTVPNVINTYNGVSWADATAYTAAGAGYEFVFDPLHPNTYYRSSWNKGIFKVRNDVRIANYTKNNALIGTYKPHPAFDKYGNLWVVTSYNTAANPCVVLPKDKVENTTLAKTDWFNPTGLSYLNTGSFQRSRFIISNKNNVKIYSDCDYVTGAVTGHIVCWDNDNVDPRVDNYHVASIAHFVDQNNKQIDWTYLAHFEEDKEGMIWVGHTLGLFAFDPDGLFDDTPRAMRPYATKFSEGKGYLCEGYSVYDIGVDRDNNKWIASNNGLYFVSPDGSEVYNHFTTDNSDLPSNTVYSVECDTVNERVYIYTTNGFAEYVPHGDAAAINFDNVYAFPNPVEPDFTGMIKITNLMDNSYVTVTDRNGTIVAQFGPVMGSALWDGSDASGERVPTGLYNIYAGQGGQPATTGTLRATVMIIK